jgi:hypothetical protein
MTVEGFTGPRVFLLSRRLLPSDGISGQSLPILAPLPTIDVLWSDLHMVHKDRSLMSYESFYWTFRTARTQKILAGSGDPSS